LTEEVLWRCQERESLEPGRATRGAGMMVQVLGCRTVIVGIGTSLDMVFGGLTSGGEVFWSLGSGRLVFFGCLLV
jgi:hypothetical protein